MTEKCTGLTWRLAGGTCIDCWKPRPQFFHFIPGWRCGAAIAFELRITNNLKQNTENLSVQKLLLDRAHLYLTTFPKPWKQDYSSTIKVSYIERLGWIGDRAFQTRSQSKRVFASCLDQALYKIPAACRILVQCRAVERRSAFSVSWPT